MVRYEWAGWTVHFQTYHCWTFGLLPGRLCRCCTKHARCHGDITTTLAVLHSPGLATMRAASAPNRAASTSGTPCRTWRRWGPTRPPCSETSKFWWAWSYLRLSTPVLKVSRIEMTRALTYTEVSVVNAVSAMWVPIFFDVLYASITHDIKLPEQIPDQTAWNI